MADERQQRDEELGAALRQLPVPPAGDDFYTNLQARLDAEAEAMRPARRRGRSRWLSPAGLSVAAAVLVVALIVNWVGVPGRDGSGPFGPRPAAAITLEEMQSRVSGTLTALKTVKGELVVVETSNRDLVIGTLPARFRFVLTAEGDFRTTDVSGASDRAYDATEGVQRTLQSDGRPVPILSEARGLAPGPPDASPDPSILARSLGSLVRTFLGVRADVPVTDTDFGGRAAWRAVLPLVGARTLEVTVDMASGFPLGLIERDRETVYEDLRVENIVLDEPVERDEFQVTVGGPVNAAPVNLGFQRVGIGEVPRVVGYRPLLPTNVPAGFKRVEVAVARQAAGTGRNNPLSQNVVSVAYQRGFDRIVVSTRSTGSDPARWSDPLLALGGAADAEPVVLTEGAFAGAAAQVVVDKQGLHVWAVSDQLVLTVRADAGRDETLALVRSLAPA